MLIDFFNDYQRDPRLNEILSPYYDRNSILRIINLYEVEQKYSEKGL